MNSQFVVFLLLGLLVVPAEAALERLPRISVRQKRGEPDAERTVALGDMAVRVSATKLKRDHYLAEFEFPESKTVVRYPFESSYGEYRLDVIDLTGDLAEEVVLITGHGRGT